MAKWRFGKYSWQNSVFEKERPQMSRQTRRFVRVGNTLRFRPQMTIMPPFKVCFRPKPDVKPCGT